MAAPRRTRPKAPRRPGFTLAEVLISVILLTLAFTALMAAFGNESVVAQRGEDVMTATYLADEIRDMALNTAFAGVLALDGATYSPAVLSTGEAYTSAEWVQRVQVEPVLANDLNTVDTSGEASAARLTVAVDAHGEEVMSQVYYVFDMTAVPFTQSEEDAQDSEEEEGDGDDRDEDDEEEDDEEDDGDGDEDDEGGGPWWDDDDDEEDDDDQEDEDEDDDRGNGRGRGRGGR